MARSQGCPLAILLREMLVGWLERCSRQRIGDRCRVASLSISQLEIQTTKPVLSSSQSRFYPQPSQSKYSGFTNTLRGVNFRDDIRVVVVININTSTFYSLYGFIVSLANFYIELQELFTAERSTQLYLDSKPQTVDKISHNLHCF